MVTGLLTANTANAREEKSVANPDKFMIRLGSYYVSRADTDVTVLSSMGAGMTCVSTDFTVDDGDWPGGFTDSHRGFLLYGAYISNRMPETQIMDSSTSSFYSYAETLI